MHKYVEIEEKFDVGEDWSLPKIASLAPAGGSVVQETFTLDNTYFDTATAGLRLFGVTLRRRVGGSETGWQLKVPSGTSRIELQSGARSKSVPNAIADAVRGLLAGEAVVPVAHLVTTRTAYRILAADQQLVLEIADDSVESLPVDDDGEVRSWRQIEVEAGPAVKKKSLKQAAKLLRSAGATPSIHKTKLDEALGDLPASHGAGSGTLGELVGAYIAAQCVDLAVNDVGLRTEDDLVHKTRVAVRRLRSTLRIFDDLFEPDAAAELDHELVWYADLLGHVRDRDVLARRLTAHIAALPSDQIRGQAQEKIMTTLDQDREAAGRSLTDGMASSRYQRLITSLRSWRTSPPFTERAESKSTTVGSYIDRAEGTAYKRLRKAGDDPELLHRARKSMKRLRYAAELGTPTDDALSKIAERAKHLQTVLGDHQDAALAADFLARNAPSDDAAAAFTYGVLMANELAQAARIRSDLTSESA
ncbi:MAG TPA: CYTH and CHAD domain-containing protein [Microlunatus sp.]